MTSRAMNEIETTVRKAAIGAGLPPGPASDLALAACAACRAGQDGAGLALRAIAQVQAAPLSAARAEGDTVSGPLALAAPSAVDLALAEGRPVTVICSDAALAAFVPAFAAGLPLTARTTPEGVSLAPAAVRGDAAGGTERGRDVGAAPQADAGTGAPGKGAGAATGCADTAGARENPATPLPDDRPARATVAPAIWEQLQALAARCLVPATEASRARGAGAGAIDND